MTSKTKAPYASLHAFSTVSSNRFHCWPSPNCLDSILQHNSSLHWKSFQQRWTGWPLVVLFHSTCHALPFHVLEAKVQSLHLTVNIHLPRDRPCYIFFPLLGRHCHEWVSAWRSFTDCNLPFYQYVCLRLGPCMHLFMFSTQSGPLASTFWQPQPCRWVPPEAHFLHDIWSVLDRGRQCGWPQFVYFQYGFPKSESLHFIHSIQPA